MALPSQTARPMSRATAMYRRRRARFGPMLVVLLLIAVAGIGAWRLWPRATDAGGPPDDDRMASAALDGGRAPAIDPSITSRALPTDGRGTGDDPVIEMGGAVPPRRPVVATPPAVTNDAPPKSADPIRPNPGYIVAPASTPGATAPIAPVAVPADPGSSSSASAKARLRSGLELQAARRWVEARSVLTAAYTSSELSAADRSTARQALESINEVLVFGPTVVPGDPFAFEYTIKSGDWLERIVRTEKGATDWRFVQRINRIPRPEGIQAGRPLKLIRGPFHAVVSKPDYRLDVYLGEGRDRVFVRSFSVGLGSDNSTPVGRFRLMKNSKTINPNWRNPRTGEYFSKDDPKNPIGEQWMGLEGTEERTKGLLGYGIHGTIDPGSIGRDASLGCVRMLPADVALLYEMLVEELSTVEIVDPRRFASSS